MNNSVSRNQGSSARSGLALFVVMAGLLAVVSWFAWRDQLALLLVGCLVLILAIPALKWPDFATFVFTFLIYTNLVVIAYKFHGMPKIIASAAPLVLVIPLASYLYIRREKLIFSKGFVLLLVYLVALFASTLIVKDTKIAQKAIVNFVTEGLILYFLVVNVIRNLLTLKRVIWTLLLACCLMGGATLLQEVTRTYDNSYGGLAQRKEGIDLDEVDFDAYSGARRAQGPVGEKNRYGQILIVILPLALYLFYVEPSRRTKAFAAVSAILILSGIFLTFSRGTFVVLVMMVALLTYWHYVSTKLVLAAAAAATLIVGLTMPEYFERIGGLSDVQKLFSNDTEVRAAGGSIRGRFAENMAALNVFVDHPVLGVGPGQFPAFYVSKYGNKVGTKFLQRGRRAHNMYLEIAAETGIVGLTAFMAIVLYIMYQLWQVRRLCREHRPELANLATAFFLSLFAYLGTALFLHLSYQRYYWFLLAVASAAYHILRAEFQRSEPQQAPAKVTDSLTPAYW